MTSDFRVSPDWWTDAACAGAPEVFFTATPDKAIAICRPCPVRVECLHDAVIADPPIGVWGGLTRKERRKITGLPAVRSAALAVLRDFLTALDQVQDAPVSLERTPTMDDATATPPAAPAEPAQDAVPVGQLLAWADAHADAKIRKAAEQAKDALGVLRARRHADEQLKSIDEETARLQRRLAQLQEHKAALAPRAKKAKARDHEPSQVRAWAATQGIDLPPRGRVPGHVVASWRAAGAPALEQ